jgi:anti-sigma-K factor RskA
MLEYRGIKAVNPCDQIENVAAYALGCMDSAEREQYERHLEGCQACQVELRAYQSVVDDLALAVPVSNPPPGLRHTILQKAVNQPNRAPKQDSLIFRLRRIFQPPQPALRITGLIVIVALVFSNVLLIVQNNQLSQAEPKPFRTVMLRSSDTNNNANALLVISDQGQFGTLVTDHLAALNDQQEYQLWLIKDGKRTSGGVFKVTQTGYGWLKIESKTSLLEFQSFGVTIEPKGGSPGPTGPKVLGGNF